ncbi:MAG TPA: alpha/beta hydrolase [Campylobacterales bacterium]|nr:alpha/beta hydrolase [Campylobacterales bacterium]
MLDKYDVLVIPGLGGSDKNHWQSIWEKKYPNFKRVEQDDWNNPNLSTWLENLNISIKKSTKPIVLIAHSLGCLLITHYVKNHNTNIEAVLMVAPPDVEVDDVIKELKDFAPMPKDKLPFRSIVVISSNDPYSTLTRSEEFAKNCGSKLVNIGDKGHINSSSNLDEWEEGEKLLLSLTNNH